MRHLANRMGRRKGIAAIAATVGLVAAACGGGGGTGGAGGDGGGGNGVPSEPINIGWIPWNEDIALTYLWQHILTERGYEVELAQLDAGVIFQSMTTDELDLFFDTWLPTTHKDYWNQYGNQLEKLTKWYEKAPLALAVPEWTWNKGVHSIGDLDENAELFNGEITGIGPSAGETDLINNEVMPTYNLGDEMKHVVTSSSTMLAALESAVQAKEDIVVALWKPHWAWDAYPIKPLNDPKNAWGDPDSIWVTASGQNAEGGAFSKDYPKVAEWIGNMKLTPDQISSLSNAVVNGTEGAQERQEAAAQWAQKHQDLLSSWGIPAAQS